MAGLDGNLNATDIVAQVGLNDSLHRSTPWLVHQCWSSNGNRESRWNYLKDLPLNDYRSSKGSRSIRCLLLDHEADAAGAEDRTENGNRSGMGDIFAVFHFTIKRSSRMSSPLILPFALTDPSWEHLPTGLDCI